MEKLVYGLIGSLFIVTVVLYLVLMVLGGAELLYWIFTGDWFHFIASGSGSCW